MRSSFDRAFRRLTSAFGRYQDAPRDPDRIHELAGARSVLDDARRGMREQGVRYSARPENSDFVEPGLGTDSRSVAGKVAAGAFLVVALVVVFGVTRAVSRWTADPPLTFERVVDDGFDVDDRGRCLWTVTGELRSNTDLVVDVRMAWLETTDGVASWTGTDFTVSADEVVPVTMTFRLRQAECPASIDRVSSGNVRFNDEFTTRIDLPRR